MNVSKIGSPRSLNKLLKALPDNKIMKEIQQQADIQLQQEDTHKEDKTKEEIKPITDFKSLLIEYNILKREP